MKKSHDEMTLVITNVEFSIFTLILYFLSYLVFIYTFLFFFFNFIPNENTNENFLFSSIEFFLTKIFTELYASLHLHQILDQKTIM